MSNDSRIMLRTPGGAWRRPEVGSYDNEQALQAMLVESPDLIPGVAAAVAVDELYLPTAGSVDVVVVEPSGAITLVECKLAANSEVRRAVVGQILSYAAGTWRMTFEQFDERFRQRAGMSLIEAIEPIGQDSLDWDAEDFRLAVTESLEAGAFRLIVAVDEITDELKRIIEYLNTHTLSQLEVLALELGYVADGEVEILLPRTHGQETVRVRGAATSTSKRPAWKTEDVFTQLTSLASPEEIAAVRRLHDDVLQRGGKIYPGRGTYPTMSAYLSFGGNARAVWAVYADPSGPTAPRISLNFGSWTKNLTEEQLDDILRRLEGVPSLAPHLAKVRSSGYSTYPSIPLAALAQDEAVVAVIEGLNPYTTGV